MRKFSISEIEDSYLNFFTPAVLIAAGIFLLYLFNWPLSFLHVILSESDVNIDFILLDAIIANLTGIGICFVTYFIFIPRLKVQDAKYEDLNTNSLAIVCGVFLVILCLRIIITFTFETLGSTIYLVRPWFLYSYNLLLDPVIRVLFLSYQFIIVPIYAELLYRRTIIPLLEDRGLSPLLSVVFSSLGFCLLFLPEYIQTSNYPGTFYWFISTFLFGLATGLIYILTRNILLSILYAIIYYAYRFSGEIGRSLHDELLLTIHFLLSIIILIGGLLVIVYVIWNLFQKKSTTMWVNVIQTPSAPKITRGLIGYLVISVVLVSIQIIVSNLVNEVFSSDILLIFAANTLFYLIAFSIPFWLSITSEYAQY
ncbi:MAG: CPBP family intramembrane metalloprotease [Candidatus Heimdallarchaeota archaeon]|nr:MAG: CPBP family intramembrane metalloprotease [Candidatus Heimdallarchaeota archaeon]